MNRYDRHWGSRYDEGFAWGHARGPARRHSFGSGSGPLNRPWSHDRFGGDWHRSRYDRGIYGGGEYPGFGGYPGGRERGTYYGSGRWDTGRYDRGYARHPFTPQEAYERHPEYNRPQRHVQDRWPSEPAHPYGDVGMEDDEIRQAVRQSLYQDDWLDADRLQVEVNGGVVTITGEVDDYLEARYAWDDAWETPGVRGVINQVAVRVDGPAGLHDSMVQTAGNSDEG